MALIETKNLTRRFGRAGQAAAVDVLRGVTLAVEAGQSVAVLGPSGSGKSTLLNLLGGLDRPSSGTVSLDGKDLASLSDRELARVRNRDLGFVFQLHHLLPQCTVLENVLVPAAAGHTDEDPGAIRTRAEALLERVGLTGRIHHTPAALSGGERLRTALVRALVLGPKLVLADEPTGSVDQATARDLVDLLVELNRERKVTLVTATHAPELARRMERVLVMEDGILREDEPPGEPMQ